LLDPAADVFVPKLVADGVGDPGDKEMGNMLETTRTHTHKTGIEKKMPSSGIGESKRDVSDRCTTRTHTHETDIEKKCHPVVWEMK